MYSAKRQGRRIISSLLFFGLGFLLPSAQAQSQANADPAVQRGTGLFQQNCAACHGTHATGGIGPNLIHSGIVRYPEKYGDLVNQVIQAGRPQRGMPAFSNLTPQNISDIVAFLHARVTAADQSDSEEGGGDYPLAQLLTGNADAGKRYFNGAGKCAACHSVTGDLKGIAGKRTAEDLEETFLFPSGPESTAVVSLRSGKQVQGHLVHQDPFYISIVDTDGWYRSWPAANVTVQVKNPLAGHLELLQTISDKEIHDVFAYLETLK